MPLVEGVARYVVVPVGRVAGPKRKIELRPIHDIQLFIIDVRDLIPGRKTAFAAARGQFFPETHGEALDGPRPFERYRGDTSLFFCLHAVRAEDEIACLSVFAP